MRAGMTGHCSSEPHISLHKVETFIRGIIHSFVHHPCHTTQISNIKFSLGLGRTISERCEHNVQCSAVSSIYTYKYEDGEESEDVAQPAHVLAGGPGVPRHGALTAPCRHTSPSHWPHSGRVSQLVIYRQCIVLPRLLISWISPFVIAD